METKHNTGRRNSNALLEWDFHGKAFTRELRGPTRHKNHGYTETIVSTHCPHDNPAQQTKRLSCMRALSEINTGIHQGKTALRRFS